MYGSQHLDGIDLLAKQQNNRDYIEKTIPETAETSEEAEALLLLLEASVDELNQPMTVVLGLSELLHAQIDSNSALAKDLNIIVREIRRMSEVVRGLNLLTRYHPPTSV